MSTLIDLEKKVLNTLGDPNKRRWAVASEYPSEIQDLLVEGIRLISAMVVKDALANLLRSKTTVMNENDFVAAPSDVLFPLNIWCIESDGLYGRAWDYVSHKTMMEAKDEESNAAQDSSNYRMWTAIETPSEYIIVSYITGYRLYPSPAAGRTIKLEYLVKPTESGTMTMTDLLLTAVKNYAISNAASKKSFDLNLANLYEQKWRSLVSDINRKFQNVHGMTSAEVGVTNDVMGWW